MNKDSKIYIAGHRGLVGCAVSTTLKGLGYTQLLQASRQDLDLTDCKQTFAYFEEHKPEYVVLAAAKVGGIFANNTYPVDFLVHNLAIQNNVIQACHQFGVKRLIFLGSSCIYPRDCPQPIKEEYLLTGPLESTNRPYALAKIAGIELCHAYNRQYGTQYLCLMPTNLYGPGDNYHPQNSHVIPGILRKCHEAKLLAKPSVEIWGTGKPLREFLFSLDLGQAIAFFLQMSQEEYQKLLTNLHVPLVNVGAGKDITIHDLAKLIASVVGFEGSLTFNADYPDGTPRKLLCVDRINRLGWQAKTSLVQGLEQAYTDFLNVATDETVAS